jgi:hypothetical protein
VDVLYLHFPAEQQLQALGRQAFMQRLAESFAFLEVSSVLPPCMTNKRPEKGERDGFRRRNAEFEEFGWRCRRRRGRWGTYVPTGWRLGTASARLRRGESTLTRPCVKTTHCQ